MSTNDSDPFDWCDRATLETPDANQPDPCLEHVRVAHDDRPDEYGVTPTDMESGRLTVWITIDADDMVDLDEWR